MTSVVALTFTREGTKCFPAASDEAYRRGIFHLWARLGGGRTVTRAGMVRYLFETDVAQMGSLVLAESGRGETLATARWGLPSTGGWKTANVGSPPPRQHPKTGESVLSGYYFFSAGDLASLFKLVASLDHSLEVAA